MELEGDREGRALLEEGSVDCVECCEDAIRVDVEKVGESKSEREGWIVSPAACCETFEVG